LLDALDFLSDIPHSFSFHTQPFVPAKNDGLKASPEASELYQKWREPKSKE